MKPDDRDGSIPLGDEQEAPSRIAIRAAQSILEYTSIDEDINLNKHPAVKRIARHIDSALRQLQRS